MNNRYARQISLAEIGADGQEKISQARIAVVGCGGLGGIAAAYLAGAGVGYLRLIDGDQPNLSNLHRQVFFQEADRQPKAELLAARLQTLNTQVVLEAKTDYLAPHNAAKLLAEVDLVLECTDQADIKHLVSDYCALNGQPLIYAAIHRYQGYVALFPNQQASDCHLRDLFPEPDPNIPNCATVGVLNTAAGLIGLLQANEALKWILGIGQPLDNRLLTYDCLNNQQQIIGLRKTFTADLAALWPQKADEHQPDALEISWAALAEWPPERYQLYSLLPEVQEPDLVAGAQRFRPGILTGEGKKLFYCHFGRQSLAVAQQLRKKGIAAYSLQGGLAAKP